MWCLSFSIRLFSLDKPLYMSLTGDCRSEGLSALGLDGPSMLFSHVALAYSFLPAEAQECSLLSRSSLGFIVCSCFDDGHFVGIPIGRFDSQFSKNEL